MSENLKGRDNFRYVGIDERIILIWSLKNMGVRAWT
jgi:hypothetical protein